MNSQSQGRGRSRSFSYKRSRNTKRGSGANGRPQAPRKKRGHGQYIDPKRFVKAAKPVEVTEYVSDNTFANFDLHDIIAQNLSANSYHKPTMIQDYALPHGLAGRDVVGIANTGTGKTAAFLIPILNQILHNPGTKALVLAPTRELALQIQEESRTFARSGRIKDALVIGGTPVHKQIKMLSQERDIYIGTPGRVKDMVERGYLDLNKVSLIALDEVDRMLDMGFVNDMRFILGKVRRERQSLFFSATMTNTVRDIIQSFTNDPKTLIATTAETSDNVDQSVVYVQNKSEKVDKLHDLLIGDGVEKTIVFCETKHFSSRLSRDLNERGFKTDVIHGNKTQSQRQRALTKFKQGHIDVIVATDVAARGIDIDGVSHVINFDQPHTYSDYTHRIGRTGRSGKIGYAITFVDGAPTS